MSSLHRRFRESAGTAARLLNRDPSAASVLRHAASVMHANDVYQQIAPSALIQVSRIANVKSGIIVIHADHGAAANKLRLQTRLLMDGFLKRGVECTGIEIRVQGSPFSEPEPTSTQKPIGEQALASLTETLETMPAESGLRHSLQRLVDRSAKR